MIFHRIRRPQHPVLLILGQIRDATTRTAAELKHLTQDIHILRRDIVARFDALFAELDEHDATVAAAVQRVADAVAALRSEIESLSLDTEDQARVDEAVNRLQASTDAVAGIGPVRQAAENATPAQDAGPAQP